MVSRKVQRDDSAERVAAVAAEQAALTNEGNPSANLVLANGIVFRKRPVPPLLIRRAARNVPRPVVPTVWLESKGRDEENPNDPTYLAAMQEYLEATGLAALDAVIIVGLALEHVPDGIDRPEDNGWLRNLN